MSNKPFIPGNHWLNYPVIFRNPTLYSGCAETVVHPNKNKSKLTNINMYGVILNMLIGLRILHRYFSFVLKLDSLTQLFSG